MAVLKEMDASLKRRNAIESVTIGNCRVRAMPGWTLKDSLDRTEKRDGHAHNGIHAGFLNADVPGRFRETSPPSRRHQLFVHKPERLGIT